MRPSTPKQRALLAFLGLPAPSSFRDASDALDRAIGDERNAQRLDEWASAKLRLHPDLYAKEIVEMKESRGRKLRDFVHEWNAMNAEATPIKRINIKQSQQVVEWLDAHHPNWDAQLWDWFGINSDTAFDFYFPAVAKLFPDLAKRTHSIGEISPGQAQRARSQFPSRSPRQPRAVPRRARSKRASLLTFLILAGLGWIGWKSFGPTISKSLFTPTTPRPLATPTPPPPATPRPLPVGPAVEAAKQRAAKAYPALTVPNAPLNREFLELVKRAQIERPQIFDDPEWPTLLAREAVANVSR